MKILGLNWGRVNGINRMLIDAALEAAKQAGAEVELVNTVNMKIGRCIGCEVCSRKFRAGAAPTSKCVIDDDYQILVEKFYDADAVICAVPVYILIPTGQYKNFVDRLGPANDYASIVEQHMSRRMPVMDPDNPLNMIPRDQVDLVPLDKRLLKQRPIAYISVGGAKDHNWVSMCMPQLKFLGFPVGCREVDEIDFHGLGRLYSDPELKESLLARCAELGRNVVAETGKHPDDMVYHGENKGVCPVCHCDYINVTGNGTQVECPICGMTGELTIKDGAIDVQFPVEELDFARLRFGGLLEHRQPPAFFTGECRGLLLFILLLLSETRSEKEKSSSKSKDFELLLVPQSNPNPNLCYRARRFDIHQSRKRIASRCNLPKDFNIDKS